MTIQYYKQKWNTATARCRKLAKTTRAGFCEDWRSLWDKLRTSKPRQLWNVLRQYTSQPTAEATSSLDDQLQHWESQGDVEEAVWSRIEKEESELWGEWLRAIPPDTISMSAVSEKEAADARKRLKGNRSPGEDGIPADVLKNLGCLLEVSTLLFSVLTQSLIYPSRWGLGLIRALLKPGKPANFASSLRGIRLLNSWAAWFGQVIDRRARSQWQPTEEQFGFQAGLGCLEAVIVLIALIHSRTCQNRRLFVLWIDLRTAFPSLNRAILIRRMFQCGLSLGLCRMVLAMLDSTRSAACIGKMISRWFKETRGTREGAVESPHLFNIYISGLRARLEQEHPRLCTLLGCIIAALLYADDAAIPADSLEDLQLAASIAEQFFNESQLYISTPKTFVTVFHAKTDTRVEYRDGDVYVDGVSADLFIYGEKIKATSTFKYLGVHFNEYGDNATHVKERTVAYIRTSNLLFASLRRIPSHSLNFAIYLWQALVVPVACYGFEVFGWCANDIKELEKHEKAAWRNLLVVGGRAPTATVQLLLGIGTCVAEWRIRRLGLFIRLLRSSPGSWTQLALIFLHEAETEWFQQVSNDFRKILPGVSFARMDGTHGAFLRPTSHVRESQNKLSRLLWQSAMLDASGNTCSAYIKYETRKTLKALRLILLTQERQAGIELLRSRLENNSFAKGSILLEICSKPSLEPCNALDLTGARLNRAAVASLLCGDWCLAIHAGNFFAKEFVPKSSNHVADSMSLGMEPSRVCLSCWHQRRQMYWEDEGHVAFDCPDYEKARELFVQQLSDRTRAKVDAALGGREKLVTALCSVDPGDWKALGSFAAHVRQKRRRIRQQFEARQSQLISCKFEHRRLAWQQKGLFACRHGVLFDLPKGSSCPCMQRTTQDSDWRKAKYMTRIDHDLKNIVAVQFVLPEFRRLGQLRAELKRLNYT